MSAPTKPFAKGYGVLFGILVLWALAWVVFYAVINIGRMLFTDGGEPPA